MPNSQLSNLEKEMKQYHDALERILNDGEDRTDRTGVGTRGIFGMQMRYDLTESFPAVTTKKLAWKSVVSELLWFLEGSGDERRLAEILHGTRDLNKRTIWTDNANAEYWKGGKFSGDLGRVYGVQWRSWAHFSPYARAENENDVVVCAVNHVDQIQNLINDLKKNPYSRRHILSAWNPGELPEMALPPCHLLAQFYVSNDNKLSCHMYQRSADMFLGVPFNIASYSLLTYMLAQVTELQPGEFIHTIGDAHIYNNHFDAVQEQLSREEYPLPTLWLNPDIKDINQFTMNDIVLQNYKHHETISAKMAV
jgi:thymidylate synthase